METYDYAAVDAAGKRHNGSVTALSQREARDVIRARKLTPISLKAAKSKSKAGQDIGNVKTEHKDITLAMRQMAILLGAATPVEEALKIAALQFEKSPMRNVLLAVRGKVLEGARLSEAMRGYPKSFSSLMTAMVASGESSGTLPEVLERIATDLEAEQKIRRKILAAMIYPLVLSFVALLVVVILMVVVVPKVVAQFETFGQDLPNLTKAVIAVSEWLQAWGLLSAAVIAGLVIVIKLAFKKPSVKLWWHGVILKLPVIGKVVRNLNAARFSRTIAGLVASGTPSLAAMETARHTLKNGVMNAAVKAAAEKVREGSAISTALRQSDVFPPLVVQMVAGGEASGDVGQMFTKSADYLESEFESATSVFLSLLEPLIIIALSAVVLLIIAAIFLPILRLNTLAF